MLELLGGGEIRQGWCCGWMLGMQACLGNWVCLWMVVTLWERLWAQWVDMGRWVEGSSGALPLRRGERRLKA